MKRASLALCTPPTLEVRQVTEDDLELIEMRYTQLLAVMNLEVLFAEGQLERR